MANNFDENDHIDVLEDRVEDIEKLLHRFLETRPKNGGDTKLATNGCCSLPKVPSRPRQGAVSAFREGLIAYSEKKWANGTMLRYYFFNKAPLKGHISNVKMVREAFDVWKDLGIGLEFEETKNISDAEIRIAFQPGIGSWSYVGTDNLQYPGQYEPTMNFGWDLRYDPRGIDTPTHEIGHALGFPHEHQNPNSGIVWDEAEVIRYFSGPPNNWNLENIRRNILNKHSSQIVEGSQWDPDSVMHYGFEPGLILQPGKYQSGLKPAPGLSATDKAEVVNFYPLIATTDYATLCPMVSDVLDLQPGDQRNYIIRPEETRVHTIRTIGVADTLLVLFRKEGARHIYVKGSDDSGTDNNAQIEVRLERGCEYVLRARLLSNYGTRAAAVIYW